MRKKVIFFSPYNGPSNTGGNTAMFYKGIEDKKGVTTKMLNLDSNPKPAF